MPEPELSPAARRAQDAHLRRLEIIRRAQAGERQKDIAADLGVSPGRVWQIIHRESEVTDDQQ